MSGITVSDLLVELNERGGQTSVKTSTIRRMNCIARVRSGEEDILDLLDGETNREGEPASLASVKQAYAKLVEKDDPDVWLVALPDKTHPQGGKLRLVNREAFEAAKAAAEQAKAEAEAAE